MYCPHQWAVHSKASASYDPSEVLVFCLEFNVEP